MALQLRYEAPNGVVAETAYAYIKSLTETDGSIVSFQLFIYYTKKMKDENKDPLYTRSFTFVPDILDDSLNYRKQGYNFLKTEELFKNAINVLEEGQTPFN
ncbi:hypothetical protein [Bacillus massiliglaciei]|uniref:hypothetical protein n=1 Tax=Bacillus massiliglaciei TaxID=1816693 RepID=UPI000DA6080F|nr:hypothetical protein [Bacillus massiliglaciei]